MPFNGLNAILTDIIIARRSFSTAAPLTWNSLPPAVLNCDSLSLLSNPDLKLIYFLLLSAQRNCSTCYYILPLPVLIADQAEKSSSSRSTKRAPKSAEHEEPVGQHEQPCNGSTTEQRPGGRRGVEALDQDSVYYQQHVAPLLDEMAGFGRDGSAAGTTNVVVYHKEFRRNFR